MKGLLISLLIMAPLYLFLCQEQSKQMDALSESSMPTVLGEQPVADSNNKAQPLRPYQRQIDAAKGVEAMLIQGMQDRMRNVDDQKSVDE